MVYSEKAQECKEVAESCFHSGRYNSAAGRYYYCLFLTAKGMLEQNNFDYKDEHISKKDIAQCRETFYSIYKSCSQNPKEQH